MKNYDEKDKDKIISALQSEIAMLKSILYQVPGNLYWKSSDDCYLGSNINHAKMFNFSNPEDIVGRYGSEFLPANIAVAVRQADSKIIEAKTEISFEEKGIDENGKPAMYLSRKTPLFDEEKRAIGILGISIDITKQKQVEEKLKIARKKAEAASKAKSQFLAMISHEIRIPLTSILGFTHFLQQKELANEEKQNYLEHLTLSGNYLLGLINKLLDYSKLEASKTDLILMPINLKTLIEEIKLMLMGNIKSKALSLFSEYDMHAPETIMADAQILRQILINLLGNAIKFTQAGSVTIIVKCIEKTSDEAKLEIAVQDTGIGIPADKLKDVFKAFYQVEDIYTRSTSASGTGLGLAIIKKLVKLHGGTMYVRSEINEGSTFSFITPFQIVQKPASPTLLMEKPIENTQSYTSRGLRVLLIEDDLLVQFIHKKMLTDLGFSVDLAENARRALDMIKNDYNIIFADIGLPDLSGFDLIKEIRKQLPNLPHIPIAALTGFCGQEEVDRCIMAGADTVMIKPVSQSMLNTEINRLIMMCKQ